MLQTEFSFTLPHGYVDSEGDLHREGTMRMATAYDEIVPLKDRRVRSNPGYLVIILLARVITRLAYLQDLYQRINQNGHNHLAVTCPHCEEAFEVELDGLGG
jgi:hypothetical protein